jgi:hypothetical protein
MLVMHIIFTPPSHPDTACRALLDAKSKALLGFSFVTFVLAVTCWVVDKLLCHKVHEWPIQLVCVPQRGALLRPNPSDRVPPRQVRRIFASLCSSSGINTMPRHRFLASTPCYMFPPARSTQCGTSLCTPLGTRR